MKCLVTGVAGFIGFHLARRLVEQGHEVVGIDNINPYYDVTLKIARLRELGVEITDTVGNDHHVADGRDSRMRFVRLDVTDQDGVRALFASEDFDVVFHLAAQAGVRFSLTDPFAYTANNVHGFLSVLEAARKHPVRHLVYASSSSVYGLDPHVPFGETGAADHPVSLYAATKRSNELMAHSYSHLFGIPTTGLRFFTVYGPWGRPDMALFLFTKEIPSGDAIDLYNHGEMERDFTYIDDVVDGIVSVLDRPPQGHAAWDGRESSISPAPARVYKSWQPLAGAGPGPCRRRRRRTRGHGASRIDAHAAGGRSGHLVGLPALPVLTEHQITDRPRFGNAAADGERYPPLPPHPHGSSRRDSEETAGSSRTSVGRATFRHFRDGARSRRAPTVVTNGRPACERHHRKRRNLPLDP